MLPVMVVLGTGLARTATASAACRSEPNCFAMGTPSLVAAMIDELRVLHLGVPRPMPHAPCASDQLRAAYEAARRDDTSSATVEA